MTATGAGARFGVMRKWLLGAGAVVILFVACVFSFGAGRRDARKQVRDIVLDCQARGSMSRGECEQIVIDNLMRP